MPCCVWQCGATTSYNSLLNWVFPVSPCLSLSVSSLQLSDRAVPVSGAQIQAYMLCNKLRSAYLVSVRQEKGRAVQLVQHVRQLAESSGDDVVKAICAQWLSVHQPKGRSRLPQGTRK